jgi:hypothetical protein
MKKKINPTKSQMPVIPQYRSLRRFVKKVFASFIKRQTGDAQEGFQKEVVQKLQGLEAKIEIISRRMAQGSKQRR